MHVPRSASGATTGVANGVATGPDAGDGCIHVVLGDVAGKGVAAALVMSHLQAAFRALADLRLPLAETVARAGRLLHAATPAQAYATLVVVRLGCDGSVEVCNAGHCPPVVLRGGAARRLPATGLPLGLMDRAEYRTHRLMLAPGDTLVAWTDGLPETADADGGNLGASRVEREAARLRETADSLDALLDGCLTLADQFRGAARPTDDLSLMAIRLEEPARAAQGSHAAGKTAGTSPG